jgi:hypothetical protein
MVIASRRARERDSPAEVDAVGNEEVANSAVSGDVSPFLLDRPDPSI